jgi:putative endonuclease
MNWLQMLSHWWQARQKAAAVPQTLGNRGESAAEQFLVQQGYRIIERQAECRLGEIDLVALDGRAIVFVEVKTRRGLRTGHPADAVDQRKQAKLTRLAMAYLKRRRWLNEPARFDVIAITWPDDAQPPNIEHYKNAFPATGSSSFYS